MNKKVIGYIIFCVKSIKKELALKDTEKLLIKNVER
jgi:hypothetical protein